MRAGFGIGVTEWFIFQDRCKRLLPRILNIMNQRNPLIPSVAIRQCTLLLLTCLVHSCASRPESPEMNQASKIGSALRQLLAEQRSAIEKDVPSAYEAGIFRGGIVLTDPTHLTIGKWQVQIRGATGKAKFQQRYGTKGRFETEELEVDLRISEDSIVVEKWTATQGRGK